MSEQAGINSWTEDTFLAGLQFEFGNDRILVQWVFEVALGTVSAISSQVVDATVPFTHDSGFVLLFKHQTWHGMLKWCTLSDQRYNIHCHRPYCLTFCPLSLVSSAHLTCKPGVESSASYATDKMKEGRHTAGYNTTVVKIHDKITAAGIPTATGLPPRQLPSSVACFRSTLACVALLFAQSVTS